MVVRVDDREPEDLVEELEKFKIEVDHSRIEVGDIVIGDDAWERKTTEDFVRSLNVGRLWEQVKELKRNYVSVGLIFEGKFPSKYPRAAYLLKRRMRLTMATIRKDWGVPIDHTENIEDTAMFIASYYARVNKEKRKYYRPVKKQSQNPYDIASDILCALPNVGRVTADRMLEEHGSIREISNLERGELSSIKGISKDAADRIFFLLCFLHNQEIL